jgi:hypothetical protein
MQVIPVLLFGLSDFVGKNSKGTFFYRQKKTSVVFD